MIDIASHPRLLKILSRLYHVRMALRRRSTASREAAKHRTEFYESAWRDAAKLLGATMHPLGYGVYESSLGTARTRLFQNYTSLDDPVTLAIAGNKPLVYRMLVKHN